MNSDHFDKWLFALTFILIGIGAIMVYSSTSVVTPVFEKRNISSFFYFRRHLLTIVIGAVFMFAAYKTRTETLKKIAAPLLVFSLALLVLVFMPGIGMTAGGARRWIRFGFLTFQPSELVKLAMVIFLAKYMSMPDYRTDRFASFAIPVFIMGVFQAVFLKQPDFGATMSLGILTFAMLTLSGIRLRYIIMLLLSAAPALVYLVREPYRMKRVLSFLDPFKDPQGSGFQLVQSFIALGSGGLTGVGLGESKQKLSFLPESHTDFIFSLVGEELGFVGALFLVGLFLALFVRGILIAGRTKDSFAYYLASGISMMVAVQSLINFAVTTGLVPTKGLPLPFISYGGSSLLINMCGIGILLNLSRVNHTVRDTDRTKGMMERKKALLSVYGRGSALSGSEKINNRGFKSQ